MTEWTAIADRKPKPEDCDEQGCVIAWHMHQGAIILHRENLLSFGGFVTHWMKTPDPPAR